MVVVFPSEGNRPPADSPAVLRLRFADGDGPIGTDFTLGSKSPPKGPGGFSAVVVAINGPAFFSKGFGGFMVSFDL